MNVYRATPLKRSTLRKMARSFRALFGKENDCFFDVVRFLEIVWPTIDKGFVLRVCTQEEMGNNHGLTNPLKKEICVRNDIYIGACRGNGRDLLTLAHELAHYLLHDGVMVGLARASGQEHIPAYCDPEWQATAFAGELLMPAELIKGMSTAEVVKACRVSYDAANYQLRKI